MTSVIGLFKRIYTLANPPKADVSAEAGSPIKFGILGAANIAPPALTNPAISHPEVEIYAVAARDEKKAQQFAKKHGIAKFYGGKDGYQKLLDDPEVEVVYNPLPNGLHYEWTMKALAAGKHVLLEKPSCDTAEETRRVFEFAEKKGLVVLEAFHFRFHPAIQRVKQIIDSGEIGTVKETYASLVMPGGVIKDDDIRFQYDLGGGSLMDMGCYTLMCTRYLLGTNPSAVVSATAKRFSGDNRVDVGTTAELTFPAPAGSDSSEPIKSKIHCDFKDPKYFGIIPRVPDISVRVTGTEGSVELYNFVMPTLYHHLTVRPTGKGKKTRTEKVYKFADGTRCEEWWSTYRLQLEALVHRLRGRTPQTWVEPQDSIDNILWIEKVYEATGLGSRPPSSFVLPESA
ncbi:NAD(P)-binding protein [Coniophora puteana RWD-64-598 SS2]|uniref:D-xylose 1-dehydrogenase (NADP(+), D-xylono-1,5-lactone-forming) n=1 Tax=Coniophora puteana (strain RWD-64-598) TaxID=741705 RepID=A0A5M3MPC9_CONPW|nr:NAD(P)-binding protein [Coniophora puteana RWD-64-598 SS2]EIW80900.1 NAD(P)-binding protein [Coniophora puteana RWD-64-598 SS2]